jgi:hypothetical protein
MARELKSYELKATKRPAKWDRLSTTVAIEVYDKEGDSKQFYCYASFSDKLVEAAGKRLPYGVSPKDPAYLWVQCFPEDKVWHVWARYFGPLTLNGTKLLFTAGEQPAWLNFYKVKKNGIEAKGQAR